MKFFKNLSLLQKINFSFFVSSIAIAILIAIPFRDIINVIDDYEQELKNYGKIQNHIYTINSNLKSINSFVIEASLKETPFTTQVIESYYETINSHLKELDKNFFFKKKEQILTNIKNRLIGYKAIALSLKNEMQEDFEDGVYAILALSQAHSKISDELNKLLNQVEQINQFKLIEIKANTYKTIITESVIILLVLILIVIFNTKIAHNIVSDIDKLYQMISSFFDVLKRKRQTTLHFNIDSNDEIGKIAKVIDENIKIAEKLIHSEREKTKEIEIQVERATKEIKQLNKDLHLTQKEIIHVMGSIAEEHSKETGLHIKRVANYSFLLAKLAGLSLKEAILLRDVSPMHDIGKLGIPDAVLNKPAKFTDEEYEIMKQHPTIGYNMLKDSKRELLQAAAIVAYEHHERWDGKGYPRGLKGEQIHIYGRITAIADVFDALGSDRVYKKAWPIQKILKLFEEEAGRQFDPRLISLFIKNINLFIDSKKSIESRQRNL